MKELKLEAVSENLDQVQAFVDAALEAVDCPMKTMMRVSVVVEEVFVNIANYAYGEGKGEAVIGVDTQDGVLTLRFEDWGMPYDPLSREEPDITLSAEDRPIGGLGIFMVKKMMDTASYAYCEGRNILTLTKRI